MVYTDWYLPGYRAGGPIRSLANLIDQMPHRFSVITRITDHHSSEPYADIVADEWTTLNERVRVMYCSVSNIQSGAYLNEINKSYDWVYLNSLFSPAFTIKPLRKSRSMKLNNRVIVAPRGMLKPGALSIKAGKKKWFLRLAKWLRWYEGVRWHATHVDEMKEIQHHFDTASEIVLAPNLAQQYAHEVPATRKRKGELKLACVARISPEKGILEAIEFLAAARLTGDVQCDFIGTMQDESYLKRCQESAQATGVVVQFKGEMAHHDIAACLSHYHFLYMPTWGENFGHAIAEGLQLGLPVIISDRTPWRQLSEAGVGYDLPLEKQAFVPVLHHLEDLGDDEYQSMRARAIAYGRNAARDESLIADSKRLFYPLVKIMR